MIRAISPGFGLHARSARREMTEVSAKNDTVNYFATVNYVILTSNKVRILFCNSRRRESLKCPQELNNLYE